MRLVNIGFVRLLIRMNSNVAPNMLGHKYERAHADPLLAFPERIANILAIPKSTSFPPVTTAVDPKPKSSVVSTRGCDGSCKPCQRRRALNLVRWPSRRNGPLRTRRRAAAIAAGPITPYVGGNFRSERTLGRSGELMLTSMLYLPGLLGVMVLNRQ